MFQLRMFGFHCLTPVKACLRGFAALVEEVCVNGVDACQALGNPEVL
jgi:hypothetical protein